MVLVIFFSVLMNKVFKHLLAADFLFHFYTSFVLRYFYTRVYSELSTGQLCLVNIEQCSDGSDHFNST